MPGTETERTHSWPITFELPGPETKLTGEGLILRKTEASRSFSLTSPVLHRFSDNPASIRAHTGPPTARASAIFQLDFEPDATCDVFGVFPADLELDSRLESAAGKRCALMVWGFRDGCAQVLADGKVASVTCHGTQSDRFWDLRWKRHDVVEVVVEFASEGTTAQKNIFRAVG